jgi:hypothetical protein
MLKNLPLVPDVIDVPVLFETGLTMQLTPLSDEEYWEIDSASAREYDATGKLTGVVYALGKIPALFASKIKGIAPAGALTIGGQPFDPANPSHLRSIPVHWKSRGLMRLISYAQGVALSEEEEGNSISPATDSTTEAVPAAG